MPFILEWEGTTFENDPDDPGGATKFGIDQRSHPNEDIRNLTRERAYEIYFQEYWEKANCGELPQNVGEVVMNISVNAGHGRSGKWLQQILNEHLRGEKLVVDGAIGSKTVAVALAVPAELVTEALLDRTEQHYRSIARGRLAKFLKGWLNRNNSLRKWVAKN